VRADAPVALAHPHLFVSENTPDSEIPTVWDEIVAENERREHEEREAADGAFAAEAAKNKIKLPEPDVVTAKQDFAARYLGQPTLILKGSKALSSDAIVTDHLEMWR
jgi:hypothetical protein